MLFFPSIGDRLRALLRSSFSAIALSTLLCVGSAESAWASPMMIEIPLPANADARKVLRQAELMVSNILDQQFGQNPDVSSLEVVILGNRDGAIVPMLTTIATREEWAANPQVDRWTAYNSSFARLFYQPRPADVVIARAPQPQGSPRTRRTRLPQQSVVQIERAYDAGRLSPRQLDTYLDLLD